MCLIATHRKPKVAKEDIVVYKVVSLCNRATRICTPYLGVHIPATHLFAKGKSISKIKLFDYLFYKESREIYEGYLHAYIRKPVIYLYRYLTCKIPKGTEYWVGNNNDICAKELIIVDKTFNGIPLEDFGITEGIQFI